MLLLFVGEAGDLWLRGQRGGAGRRGKKAHLLPLDESLARLRVLATKEHSRGMADRRDRLVGREERVDEGDAVLVRRQVYNSNGGQFPSYANTVEL